MRLMALTFAAIMVGAPSFADFITKPSDRSVTETMDALEAAVTGAGATVFARLDHAAGARSVDLELDAAQLLIFGNPALGTPAMQDDLRAGLVLPLRVLVYDDEGQTRIIYESVDDLFDKLDVDDGDYVQRIEGALNMLTDKAVAD